MFLAGAALLALSLSADPPLSLDVGALAEVRERTPETGEAWSVGTTELMLVPTITGHALVDRFALLVGYAPRLTLIDPGGLDEKAILHVARIEGVLGLGGQDRLTLGLLGTQGETPVSPLLLPAGAQVFSPESVPQVEELPYQSASAQLTLEIHPTGRLRTVLTAAYLASGGDTESAQTYLPFQQGPRATAEVDWRATRLDSLNFILLGQQSETIVVVNQTPAGESAPAVYTSSRVTSDIAQVTAGWAEQLDRLSKLTLTVGEAVAGVSPEAGASHQWSVDPVAGADWRHGLGERETKPIAFAYVLLAPSVDPLSGQVAERTNVGLGAEASPVYTSAWRLSAGAQGGVTIDGPPGSYAELVAGAKFNQSKSLVLAANAQAGYFSGDPILFGSGGQFLWLISLDAAFNETGLH